MPLVGFIARKIVANQPSSVRVDDLIQAGYIGLLDAIDKFDPHRENQFKTYAEFRIRGAILDLLRNDDLIPRSVRDKEKEIGRVNHALASQLGRAPLAKEIAETIGMDSEEYEALRIKLRTIREISIETPEQFTVEDRKALLISSQNQSDDLVSKIDAMAKLERIVRGHQPMSRAAFILYFVWGLTMDEISQVFGCTESRICQRISNVRYGRAALAEA